MQETNYPPKTIIYQISATTVNIVENGIGSNTGEVKQHIQEKLQVQIKRLEDKIEYLRYMNSLQKSALAWLKDPSLKTLPWVSSREYNSMEEYNEDMRDTNLKIENIINNRKSTFEL